MKRWFVLIFVILVTIFLFSPLNVGGDFDILRRFILGWIQGQPLYTTLCWGGRAGECLPGANGGYFYTPWATVLMLPLMLLPERIGWSLLMALSVLAVLIIGRKFKINGIKLALVLLSPPMIFIYLVGQIDAALLFLLFLPRELWVLAAGVKPQMLLGLCFGWLRHPPAWKYGAAFTILVLLLSFFFFGNWVAAAMEQSKTHLGSNVGHSFMGRIWPYSVFLGLGLGLYGFWHDDERFYLLSSPFFLSYAAVNSFIGFTLALAALLKTWQFALLIIATWGLLLLT
jgi:hypothetical protein